MNQISAKIVTDSLHPNGIDRLTTLEVVMPRYILAEFNTHRILSRNSASSRAIPFNKMVKSVQENMFIPYAWQKDHSGMQGVEYLDEADNRFSIGAWKRACKNAIDEAVMLNKNVGVTKQLCNRLLEPFMYHKVLVSGTEWSNFFELRCPQYTFQDIDDENNVKETLVFKSRKEYQNRLGKKNYTELQWLKINKGQADIHMMFLAEAIYDAINESTPKQLKEGEWHIPYNDNFDEDIINTLAWSYTNHIYETYKEWNDSIIIKEKCINEIKIKISIVRCARLSYKTLGDNPVINYEKDLELYDKLSTSGHFSPFEHVARVMDNGEYVSYIKGKLNIGYMDENEVQIFVDNKSYDKSIQLGWCRNYKGFIQQRSLMD